MLIGIGTQLVSLILSACIRVHLRLLVQWRGVPVGVFGKTKAVMEGTVVGGGFFWKLHGNKAPLVELENPDKHPVEHSQE
jgi:hypothetical protein